MRCSSRWPGGAGTAVPRSRIMSTTGERYRCTVPRGNRRTDRYWKHLPTGCAPPVGSVTVARHRLNGPDTAEHFPPRGSGTGSIPFHLWIVGRPACERRPVIDGTIDGSERSRGPLAGTTQHDVTWCYML